MAYRIAGTYAAACNCQLMCPCPHDGPPTGEGGECRGLTVFSIRDGNLDDVDLGGVSLALSIYLPSNVSSGNWTVGIVVDEGASEEQAKAVERIVSGQEGGPFADFAPLIGDYVGMERGRVSVSDGDSPSATVGDRGEFRVEPLRGPDGRPTTTSNAMFGFAPTFTVGKGTGRLRVDREVEAVYGETSDFEYTSEMGAEDVRPRA